MSRSKQTEPSWPKCSSTQTCFIYLHVRNKTFPGVNFSTMCRKKTKKKKNPQQSTWHLIKKLEALELSLVEFPDMSVLKLCNREEGTPPLWSGCLSPPSLIPTPGSQNSESKRKQSVRGSNSNRAWNRFKNCATSDIWFLVVALMWHLLQTTNL